MGFGFGLTGFGAAGGGRSVSGGPGGGAEAAAFWKALRADASNASKQSWACRAKPAWRSASQRPARRLRALPSASRALFSTTLAAWAHQNRAATSPTRAPRGPWRACAPAAPWPFLLSGTI